MFRFAILVVSAIASTLGSSASVFADSKYRVTVLEGADNVRVNVLNDSHGQLYLGFQETGTPLDGMVVRARSESVDWDTQVFRIDYHGLNYPILREQNGTYTLDRLYVDEPASLTISVLASEEMDGRAMLAQHEAQKQAGTLLSLSEFNRSERIKLIEHNLDQKNARRQAMCKTDVAVAVDWSTFEDSQFSDDLNPAWCSIAIETLYSLCADNGPFSFLSVPPENMATINAIECRAGSKNTFTIQDGTVTFEFNEILKNADELGIYVLYNALQ